MIRVQAAALSGWTHRRLLSRPSSVVPSGSAVPVRGVDRERVPDRPSNLLLGVLVGKQCNRHAITRCGALLLTVHRLSEFRMEQSIALWVDANLLEAVQRRATERSRMEGSSSPTQPRSYRKLTSTTGRNLRLACPIWETRPPQRSASCRRVKLWPAKSAGAGGNMCSPHSCGHSSNNQGDACLHHSRSRYC